MEDDDATSDNDDEINGMRFDLDMQKNETKNFNKKLDNHMKKT